MEYPSPRANEKRGIVSRETIKDRQELAGRLAGSAEIVAMLKPILQRRFAPRPLKKALLEYLTFVGAQQGGRTIPRLSVRHIDGLVELFTRWCPGETELALAHSLPPEPPALDNPQLPFPVPLAVPIPPQIDGHPDEPPEAGMVPSDEIVWELCDDQDQPFLFGLGQEW
jgi:hypothetical protein